MNTNPPVRDAAEHANYVATKLPDGALAVHGYVEWEPQHRSVVLRSWPGRLTMNRATAYIDAL